jgi:hypothetical protein
MVQRLPQHLRVGCQYLGEFQWALRRWIKGACSASFATVSI